MRFLYLFFQTQASKPLYGPRETSFIRKEREISTISWSAYSPDFNLVETMWDKVRSPSVMLLYTNRKSFRTINYASFVKEA